MSRTIKNIRAKLDPDELDYENVALQLGVKAIPYLRELVNDMDIMIASKAAYVASLIESAESVSVLETAALNPEPVVRTAVASGLRNLKEQDANRVSKHLIKDKDMGVRTVTLKSISKFRSPTLIAKMRMMARRDPEVHIRKLARTLIKSIK